MDFGGLKAFKEWSEYMFDHSTIIATDDPHLEKFLKLAELGLNDVGGVLDLRLVPGVGCEKFSELAFFKMKEILETFQRGETWTCPNTERSYKARYPVGQGVRLRSAEVFEHAGNSAVYEG